MSVRTLYDVEFGQFGQTEGVFDPTRGGSSRFRDALSAGSREESDDMHRAMLEHQFSVYYQPVIEVASGRLVGAEALLRWHRDGGSASCASPSASCASPSASCASPSASCASPSASCASPSAAASCCAWARASSATSRRSTLVPVCPRTAVCGSA